MEPIEIYRGHDPRQKYFTDPGSDAPQKVQKSAAVQDDKSPQRNQQLNQTS
jgi:hypothetical protein